ncbi:MAG: TolC family protein [Planctomycetia bacterium]|nr:TolC family protein [Planctomycetia bacterium]
MFWFVARWKRILWPLMVATSVAGCRSAHAPFSNAPLVAPALSSSPAAAFHMAPPVLPSSAPQALAAALPRPSSVGSQQIQLVSYEQANPAGAPRPEEVKAPPILGELSLDQAIAISIGRNPDFVTRTADEPVSQSAIGVARAPQFAPTFQAQLAPSPREEHGDSAKTKSAYQLTQTFEINHQRQIRTETSQAQLDQTQRNIQQTQVLTIAETERRFFAALYQRQVRDLTLSLANLNEELHGVLQRRFDAGRASAADVALAHIEARATRQQAGLAQEKYVTTLVALRNQIGVDPRSLPEPTGDLQVLSRETMQAAMSTLLDAGYAQNNAATAASAATITDDNLAQWAADRPDVMAAEAELRAAESQFNLARASLVPDLSIGPYFERDEHDTQFWGFVAQMNVPVLYTASGRPLVNQRAAELERQRIALQQLRVKAQLEIKGAVERYQAALKVVDEFHDDANERLAGDVQRIQNLFEAGQGELLPVYAGRNSVLQFRKDRVEALNDLGQAVADLTAATGKLPGFIAATSNRPYPSSCPPATP